MVGRRLQRAFDRNSNINRQRQATMDFPEPSQLFDQLCQGSPARDVERELGVVKHGRHMVRTLRDL